MKALSILQPWSLLIVSGEKTVENRSWSTPYRGEILIHAGKSRRLLAPFDDSRGEVSVDDLVDSRITDALFAADDDPFNAMAFGAIVGKATIVNCTDRMSAIAREDRTFAEGPWCWILRDPVRFKEPIPYRGQLYLFDVPDEVVAEAQPL